MNGEPAMNGDDIAETAETAEAPPAEAQPADAHSAVGPGADDSDCAPQAEGFSDEARNMRIIEALLFAADEPMSEEALAQQLKGEGADPVPLLEKLAETYAARGVNLCRIAGGWAFRTAPDLSDDLTVYRKVKRRLSRAALETLAIIAYHQPITRAEVEDVRGVALSRGTLDQLLEAGWIKPRGRRRTPGRPVTWVTTDEFLSHFGLADIGDLPGVDELKTAGLLDPQAPLPGGPGMPGADADNDPDDGDGEAVSEGEEDDADEADFAHDEDMDEAVENPQEPFST